MLLSFVALTMAICSFHLKYYLSFSSKTYPLLSLKPCSILPSHTKVSLFWNPRAGVSKYYPPKCQTVNTLGFAGLVTTTQLGTAARKQPQNILKQTGGCIPGKLYLEKQAADWIWPKSYSLSTSIVEDRCSLPFILTFNPILGCTFKQRISEVIVSSRGQERCLIYIYIFFSALYAEYCITAMLNYLLI